MADAFTNFAKSTLAGGLAPATTALSVQVGDGALFPAAGAGQTFRCVLQNAANQREVILVTARTADAFTTIVRAQEGTVALTWNAGDRIGHRLTAGQLTNILFSADLQQNTKTWCGTAGGTANALTLTPTPAVTAMVAGHKFIFKSGASANTTAVTISVSGLATFAAQNSGVALNAGDLAANSWYEVLYDGVAGQLKKYTLGIIPTASNAAELVDLLHIDSDTGHRDLIRGGWMPAFFNQQWGGAPHYYEMVDVTGVPYKFEAATGYIESNGSINFGNGAGVTYQSQGFKVSQATTPTEVWVKCGKIGAPTDNLQAQIWSDNAGSPLAALGALGSVSAKTIGQANDSFGRWVRIPLAGPALVAGTQYHLVISRSGAVDAANYFVFPYSSTKRYPFGFWNQGSAVPAWTQTTTAAWMFLIPSPAAVASLQTGGIFADGKLVFFEGSPLNQSNGRVKDLKDFQGFDITDFTLLVRGNGWTKDRTILDITYGPDHDRIVLRSNTATGFAQVDVYDSAGTKKTVTATTVDLSAGNHDVALRIRAKGDGADVVGLYVDGVTNGTQLSAQTIAFDVLFGQARVGTFWIGGGWVVAPAWSGSSISAFTGLPSTLGWTYNGTATEGSAWSVTSNIAYQNKNGYTALQTGWYVKAAAGFSNATGWSLLARLRATSETNVKDSGAVVLEIEDGAKVGQLNVQEYYLQSLQAATNAYPQVDCKTYDGTVHLTGKGSDMYVFKDMRLVIDGTGQMTTASANNQASIGDVSNTSGENADAVYKYWKYYTTAALFPQFTSGALSEMAIWNGDHTGLIPILYNSGTLVSVKATLGVQRNYVEVPPARLQLSGITSNPTTTSAAFPATVLIPEMEAFVIGSSVQMELRIVVSNSADQQSAYVTGWFDGIARDDDGSIISVSGGGGRMEFNSPLRKELLFGLHKVFYGWGCAGNTNTAESQRRGLIVDVRS